MDKLSTDGNKTKDSVIIFDGKDPNRAAKWFELSQATERFAEYHCGTPGVEIWLGVSPVLTEENVTDAAEDALEKKLAENAGDADMHRSLFQKLIESIEKRKEMQMKAIDESTLPKHSLSR